MATTVITKPVQTHTLSLHPHPAAIAASTPLPPFKPPSSVRSHIRPLEPSGTVHREHHEISLDDKGNVVKEVHTVEDTTTGPKEANGAPGETGAAGPSKKKKKKKGKGRAAEETAPVEATTAVETVPPTVTLDPGPSNAQHLRTPAPPTAALAATLESPLKPALPATATAAAPTDKPMDPAAPFSPKPGEEVVVTTVTETKTVRRPAAPASPAPSVRTVKSTKSRAPTLAPGNSASQLGSGPRSIAPPPSVKAPTQIPLPPSVAPSRAPSRAPSVAAPPPPLTVPAPVSVHPPTIAAPSIKAPSVRAPSVRAPTVALPSAPPASVGPPATAADDGMYEQKIVTTTYIRRASPEPAPGPAPTVVAPTVAAPPPTVAPPPTIAAPTLAPAPTIAPSQTFAPPPTIAVPTVAPAPTLAPRTVAPAPTVVPTLAPPPTFAPPATVVPPAHASIVPPSIAPSIRRLPTLAPATAPPASPALSAKSSKTQKSHRSHRSHHHPEVVVNVTLPPGYGGLPIIAPAPAPPPPIAAPTIIAPDPVPAVSALGLKTHPSPFAPTIAVPPSPVPSMKLPSFLTPAKKPASIAPNPEDDDVVEQVVTTTTYKRKPSPKPATPVVPVSILKPARTPKKPLYSFYVENVTPPATPPAPPQEIVTTTTTQGLPGQPGFGATTTTRAVPPPAPSLRAPSIAASPTPMSPPVPVPAPSTTSKRPGGPMTHTFQHFPDGRIVETTTVETYAFPFNVPPGASPLPVSTKSLAGSAKASLKGLPVNTAATTIGNATTAMLKSPMSVAPALPERKSLRPIPFVDYSALVRFARTPLSEIATLPPVAPTVAAPSPAVQHQNLVTQTTGPDGLYTTTTYQEPPAPAPPPTAPSVAPPAPTAAPSVVPAPTAYAPTTYNQPGPGPGEIMYTTTTWQQAGPSANAAPSGYTPTAAPAPSGYAPTTYGQPHAAAPAPAAYAPTAYGQPTPTAPPPTAYAPTAYGQPAPTAAPSHHVAFSPAAAPAPTVMRTPSVAAPKTIATISMDVDRDASGHEHIHATLRDHSGVRKVIDDQGGTSPAARSSPGLTYIPPPAPTLAGKSKASTKTKAYKSMLIDEEEEIIIPDLEAFGTPSTVAAETREERKEREKREKKMRKAAEKLAKERASEPAFRRLAEEFPAPRSERISKLEPRYAAAPKLEDIEKRARDQYEKRINGSGPSAPGLSANPHIGGMPIQMPGRSGPPPAPMMIPQPPPMVNPRPGMFGPPMMPPTHMMAGGFNGMGSGMAMGMLGGMGMPMVGRGMGTGPMPGAPLGMHARPMAPITTQMGMGGMPGMSMGAMGMPMAGGPMSNMGYGRMATLAPNSAAH